MSEETVSHTESDPSNAVLLEKLRALGDIIIANQVSNHEAHAAIIAQVVKTNGRVTMLEKAKNIGMGALIILHIIVIPVLIALAISYFNNHK